MDHLDKLENKSVHIIREAYAAFSSLGSYRDAAEQLQRFTVVRGALTGEEIHVIRDGEDTLRGLFLAALRRAYDAAETERQRERITMAARWGLAALDGEEEVFPL